MTDSRVLGAAGGSLAISNAEVTIPAGTVTASTTFTLSMVTDSGEADEFASEVTALGVAESEAFGLALTADASELLGDGVTVTLKVSAALDELVTGGQAIAAFAQGTDEIHDPEKSESHQTFDPIFGTYNGAAKTLTVTVPTSLFESDGAQLKAKLRVAVLPKTFTLSAPLTVGPRIAAGPSAASCPADASFKAPMAYGWLPGATMSTNLLPVAAVVGVFNESRTKDGKSTLGHQGIDIIAKVGTPIYAVADGFIQRTRNHNFTCPTKAGELPKEYKKVKFPEYSITLNIGGNATVTYRHIKEGSAGVYTGSTVAREALFDTCFLDIKQLAVGELRKYPVKAGQQIGVTGESGELSPGTRVGPHLHLEWLPPGDGLQKNPLCRLAKLADGGDPSVMNALAPILAGQVQPGALAFPSLPALDTRFVVRRVRTDISTAVCRVDTPIGSACDLGGSGFYMEALVRPNSGQVFALQSNGVMASLSKFESTSPRVTFGSAPTSASALSSLYLPITPAPLINVLADRGQIDPNPPCDISAVVTYQLKVNWNRANKAKDVVEAPFGPPTKLRVTTSPRPAPQAGCTALVSTLSGSN